MEWVRGRSIGHGSFGTVSLAIPRSQSSQISPLMAVKSCGVTHSASLMNEKLILDELNGCSEIVSCLGDSYSFENGEKLYNVLLEYASGGSLADKVMKSSNHQLMENETRQYTKAILRGLQFIHKSGYVHCDIKLQNILLCENGELKIADFGLAKRDELRKVGDFGCELRGTPLYMSPEMVAGGDQGTPADIWALGCVVAEMFTGAPAWRCSDIAGLLMKIGVGEDLPEIPENLSNEGKDFLGKCFVKDPRKRWTAEMLLNHPFIADYHEDCNTVTLKNTIDDDVSSTSPRCPFDFPDWVSEQSSSITLLPSPSSKFDFESLSTSPAERFRRLVSNPHQLDWSGEEEWVTVR